MEKIKGVVSAVSQKWDGGIKIGDVWYNGNKKTAEYVKKVEKGVEVELTVDDKNKIQFINVLAEPVKELPEEKIEIEEIDLTGEDKAVVIDAEVKKYGKLMEICKKETDRIFGNDEKYKEFLGQHCNSLFIALDRVLREKGIKL